MTAPPFHRKIGGIHWFALGRVRISVCLLRPKAVPKRGSALPAGEARTRARGGRIATHPLCPRPFEWPEAERVTLVPQEPTPDMPEGDYTGMTVAKWRKINSIPPLKLAPAREAVRCESIQRLPRTTVFPWPPETKQ